MLQKETLFLDTPDTCPQKETLFLDKLDLQARMLQKKYFS